MPIASEYISLHYYALIVNVFATGGANSHTSGKYGGKITLYSQYDVICFFQKSTVLGYGKCII